MNPWELLAWVAVTCAALLVVGLTVFVLAAMLRALRNGPTK